MYRSLNKKNTEIINMCDDYVKEYDDWFLFNENIDTIIKKYNDCICNYDENMELTKDIKGNDLFVTLPKMSSYALVKDNRIGIKNWVWKNIDDDINFSFDSEAESMWAEFLKELVSKSIDGYKGKETFGKSGNNFLSLEDYYWGKNYLSGSEIKYEYYLDGRHFSYPDFIMKDGYDNIHIFEVKSINNNKDLNIDKESYKRKIEELEKCIKGLLNSQVIYFICQY